MADPVAAQTSGGTSDVPILESPPRAVDQLPEVEASAPSRQAKTIDAKAFKAASKTEIVGERTERSKTYDLGDGTRVSVIGLEPKHYQDPAGKWTDIDSRAVPDPGRAGGLKSAANAWTVRFAPLPEGVRFETAGGVQTLSPVGAAAVSPQVGPEPNQVIYRNAWPNADLLYTIRGQSVEEEIVLRGRPDRTTFEFSTGDQAYVADEQRPGAVKLATEAPGQGRFAPPVVRSSKGRPLSAAKPALDARPVQGGSGLSLSVDAEWVQGLKESEFPVSIDPTWTTGTTNYAAYKSDGWWCSYCGVHLGNSLDGGWDNWWRSVIYFPYEHLFGKRITNAWVNFDALWGGTANSYWYRGCWASGWDFGNATPGGGCFDAQPMGTSGQLSTHLYSYYDSWTMNSVPGGALGFSGDEAWYMSGVYSYKYFAYTDLYLVYNSRPSAPGLVSPADQAVVTTTNVALTASAPSDDPGDTHSYRFQIATGSDGQTGKLIASTWQSSTTWTPPDGTFHDGGTFSWIVQARDQNGWESPWSTPRKFRLELGLGRQDSMPYDELGAAAVNLANGNLTLTVGGPQFPTLGGPVGVTLSYNSQTPKLAGLYGNYYEDSNHNGLRDTGEPFLVRRLDPSLNQNWGTGGPDPSSTTTDWWIARWSGGLRAMSGAGAGSGTYRIVSNTTDDKVTVKINGTTVLNQTACCPVTVSDPFTLSETGPTPIEVEYAEVGGGAQIHLLLRKDGQADQEIQPVQLSPTIPSLPDGWSRTGEGYGAAYSSLRQVSEALVAVVDGTGADHLFTSVSGGGWRPPPGEGQVLTKQSNGGWTLDDGGVLFTFDGNGALLSVGDAASDVSPGAPTNEWTSPNLNGVKRLTKVTDATGREMRLHYGGPISGSSCPAGSNAPTDMLCKVTYTGFGNTSTELTYDTSARLVQIKNPGNAVTGFVYDGGTPAKLTEVRDAFTNDLITAGQIVGPTQANNTVISYDSMNRVTSIKAPKPSDTGTRPEHTYGYELGTDGRITGVKLHVAGVAEPNGYVQRVEIDSGFHATKKYDTAGILTQITWDQFNDVITQSVDHHNVAGPLYTTYEYDSAWRLTHTYGPALSGDPSPPHAEKKYDEGFAGLNAAWYAGTTPSGPTKGHSLFPTPPTTIASQSWGTSPPAPGLSSANNFSGRLTGEIVFPATGSFTIEALTNLESSAQVYVDDQLVSPKPQAGKLASSSGPDVVRQTTDGLTMVARGAANEILISYWTGTGWTTWQDLGMPIAAASDPAIASLGSGKLDVFARGTDNVLYHRSYDGSTWSNWQTLATNVGGGLGAAAWTSNRIEIYYRGTDSNLYQYALINNVGSGPYGPGGAISAAPAVSSWGPGRFDVFWRDNSNQIQHSWHDNGTWGSENLGGTATSAPAAASMASGKIDVVVRGYDNALWVKSFSGGSWSAWSSIGGTLTSDPAIGAPSSTRLEVLAKGSNNELYQKSKNGSTWGEWVQTVPAWRTGSFEVTGATEKARTKRIRVEYTKYVGSSSSLKLYWTPPGGSKVEIPTSALKPSYGLVTSTVDPDGNSASTGYGTSPWLGLALSSTSNPGGGLTALVSSAAYDDPFFRKTSSTAPAGNVTSYDYYPATGTGSTRDIPCLGGATGVNQGGALKLRTAPDPTGTDGPKKEEFVYDSAGRIAAARVGTESWACISYDSRGRVTQKTIPAYDAQAATRAVSYSYAVGSNPAVSSVADDNPDLPIGNRTITSTVDWLGRVTQYTDVWGQTTTTVYDQAGRVASTNGPAGPQEFTYTAEGRLSTQKLDSTVIAQPSYHSTSGVMTGVSYPTAGGTNGTSGVFEFDALGRTKKVTWSQGSTVITSNEITNRKVSGKILDEKIDGLDAYVSGDNYEYDGVGRLTVARVEGHTFTYNYGAPPGSCTAGPLTDAGKNTNRVSMSDAVIGGSTTTTCYSYDEADRLTSTTAPGITGITYDAHGNTKTMGGQTMSYDGADRHVSSTAGSATVTYVRDVTDRIVKRTQAGPSTIAFRSGTTATSGGNVQTSLTINQPTGAVPGDVLIAQVAVGGGSGTTITPPSGWTAITTAANGTTVATGLYRHNVAAGDPGSWNFTWASPQPAAGAISAYSGVDTANPVDVHAVGTSTSASTAHAAPGVTTTATGDLLISAHAFDQQRTAVPETGSIERADVASTATVAVSIEHADLALTAPGNVPARTATSNQSANSVSATIALKAGTTSEEIRYGFTGGSDSAGLTLSTTNQVTEKTFVLPGGVLFTKRGTTATDVWSYPNLHGDVVATTDGTGTKQGTTLRYDPYGNPLTDLPSNSAGEFDYGWLGQHQRGLEHAAGLLPIVEMGARQYLPTLGRFLEMDSIHGGSCNPYVYTCADPINSTDLTGLTTFYNDPAEFEQEKEAGGGWCDCAMSDDYWSRQGGPYIPLQGSGPMESAPPPNLRYDLFPDLKRQTGPLGGMGDRGITGVPRVPEVNAVSPGCELMGVTVKGGGVFAVYLCPGSRIEVEYIGPSSEPGTGPRRSEQLLTKTLTGILRF